MKPLDDQSVIKDVSAFRPGLVVADAVYNPEETKLLREAKEAGCICVGGKGMLLWQGVSAFKLFTGEDMPVEEVKEKFFA
jgi:shikimate dehydrogenase